MSSSSLDHRGFFARFTSPVPAAAGLALCLLLATGASAQTAPTGGAAAVVEQALRAYGGRQKLSSLKAYRMHGTLRALMRGTTAATVRTFSRPSRLKVLLDYPGGAETRILYGERGWRSDQRGRPLPVEGFLLQAMMLQAARADIPWIMEANKDRLRDLGASTIGERSVQVIEVPLEAGLALRLYVDRESGYVLRSISTLEVPGMSTAFETHYSDFREIDGVVFAMKEENFASGRHTGSTTIKRVTVNPELDPGEFAP